MHISLASILPNRRKKSPLAPCMGKSEKELTCSVSSYMGEKVFVSSSLWEGRAFYGLTL